MREVRAVEVLAALSLTTDLAAGMSFEKGLRTCAVATEFGRHLGLSADELAVVFHVALLRSVGCTAHASETADLFDNDIAFQAALKELDSTDPAALRRFGAWAGEQRRPELVERFVELAPSVGPQAMRAACEVGHALAERLNIPNEAAAALDDVYERWDGQGNPGRVAGESISLAARIVHLSEQAVLAYPRGEPTRSMQVVTRRAGGHLDPALVTAFCKDADRILAPLLEVDILRLVVADDPTPRVAGEVELREMCEALAMVVDLKGRYLLGHSRHVADLASEAASESGLPDEQCEALELAALLHDIGRTAVPSSIWDRPGPLTPAEEERVRLHTYWTGRVLDRCPALAPLAELAAAHHERLDGSGYHRGVRSDVLDQPARLLAAADAFAELTEARPNRAALDPDAAAAQLRTETRAGRLDAEACAAVVAAAGARARTAAYPSGLTAREVDVLRLAARGMSNDAIAAELVLSTRTVGNHLAHVYDKIGRRTRAGAAVFAMEHGLLPR